MKKSLLSIAVLLVVSSLGFSSDVVETFTERSPGEFNPTEYKKEQQQKFDWLVSEHVAGSAKSVIYVEPSEQDLVDIENYNCKSCGGPESTSRKVRTGVVLPTGVDVNLTGLNQTVLGKNVRNIAGGMVQNTQDGGFVWTTAVESKDATALRIHFTNVNLPENAALYVYNNNDEAFGPFEGLGPNNNGDFWSNTLTGNMAYVQLRVFGQMSKKDLNSMNFQIADVGHITPKLLIALYKAQQAAHKACSFNADCVEDASCHNASQVNAARDAVALMQFQSGAFLYICSGGLLADTDASTQIPYFLTANHCISKNNEANSLECFWQYATTSCNGTCYSPIGTVPTTTGSSLLKSNRKSDYTLLQISQTPPSGSAFLGWTSAAVANSNGASLYRISHPQGAPQAYSEHEVDTSATTCRSWPRGQWIYSRDVVGATEGGSSGSPVLNSSGQVVGQLSGACGYNLNDVCDSDNNATVDGAFAAYFSDVAQWLNP